MQQNLVPSKTTLAIKALIILLSSLLIIGCCLFIPAGTLSYWNGWLFLISIFIPVIIVFVYLLINDPGLLAKRLKTREEVKEQRLIQKIGVIPVVIGFLLPGFDFRFKWSNVPVWLVVIGVILIILGYVLFIMVIKQNSYASRVIEIQQNQKVIDTGLYSVIRHPMYLAGIIIMLFSPVILGSFYGMIPMIFYAIIIIFRIYNEEEVLKKGLEGYNEYLKKVKYRLVPFIW